MAFKREHNVPPPPLATGAQKNLAWIWLNQSSYLFRCGNMIPAANFLIVIVYIVVTLFICFVFVCVLLPLYVDELNWIELNWILLSIAFESARTGTENQQNFHSKNLHSKGEKKKRKKKFLDAGQIKVTTTSTNTGFQYHTEKSIKHKVVYYILDKLNTQIYK